MLAEKNPRTHKMLTWFAAGVALFHIWANTFGNVNDLWRNALHLGLLGVIGYLTYSRSKKKPSSKREGQVILTSLRCSPDRRVSMVVKTLRK